MQKLFSFLLLIILSKANVSGQLAYNLQFDKPYLSNLKNILKKGFTDESTKASAKIQLRYFNTAIKLGSYYEHLYENKQVKNMAKAIKYYELVTSYGNFPGDGLHHSASALKNNLKRKLADVYFKGIGVKKDRAKSLQLAQEGSSGVNGFFKFYSKRYFNCNCIFLPNTKNENNQQDTFYKWQVNPFAYTSIYGEIIKDDKLRKVKENFIEQYAKDSTLDILLNLYVLANSISQVKGHYLAENIKKYFFNIPNFPVEKFIYNLEVVDELQLSMELVFTKNNEHK